MVTEVFNECRIPGVRLFMAPTHTDERGLTRELVRLDWGQMLDYPAFVMGYMSMTKAGQKRGPHEHITQTDCFVFLEGHFEFCLWDKRAAIPLETEQRLHPGQRFNMIVIPPRVIHGYKCLGPGSGLLLNFPNKLYKGWGYKEEVDEIRYENNSQGPYQL